MPSILQEWNPHAGITRITIGKDKYVWTQQLADDLMSGRGVGGNTTTNIDPNQHRRTNDGD